MWGHIQLTSIYGNLGVADRTEDDPLEPRDAKPGRGVDADPLVDPVPHRW